VAAGRFRGDFNASMSRTIYRDYTIGFGGGGVTYYVQLLILLNIAVFAGQLILHVAFGGMTIALPGGPIFVDAAGYSTHRLFDGWIWVPFTYMFVHGGLSHLFWNMVQLFFFGPDVERALGTRQFLRFYLFCGVAGALANLVVFALGGPSVPVIGASGAVLGVLVAFAVLDPDREVFLIPIPFPITARGIVIIFVILNLLNAFGGGSGIAVATHFGGMIAGYTFMKARPAMLRWSWYKRGKGVRKSKPGTKPGDEDEANLAKAIDNIFKFQGKDRH
jgi:membrane associated rhomboid family serine protease